MDVNKGEPSKWLTFYVTRSLRLVGSLNNCALSETTVQ